MEALSRRVDREGAATEREVRVAGKCWRNCQRFRVGAATSLGPGWDRPGVGRCSYLVGVGCRRGGRGDGVAGVVQCNLESVAIVTVRSLIIDG